MSIFLIAVILIIFRSIVFISITTQSDLDIKFIWELLWHYLFFILLRQHHFHSQIYNKRSQVIQVCSQVAYFLFVSKIQVLLEVAHALAHQA